jgi:outer membrane protein assembly factor BamE (lipoprotein component of BamABCDE complex)
MYRIRLLKIQELVSLHSGLKGFLLYSVLLLLSACNSLVTHGQYIDDQTLRRLQTQEMSKSQLEELIGAPTLVSDYNQDTWYYVERFTAKRAWFKPKTISQRIVAVSFDSAGLVSRIDLKEETPKFTTDSVTEYTQSYSKEENPIQIFVKNIGRFSGGVNKKKKSKINDLED